MKAPWRRSHKNSGYKMRRRREGALIRLLDQLKAKGKKDSLGDPLYTDKQITRMEKEVEVLKSRL